MWLCTLISGYIITEKRMEIRTHLGNAIEATDSLKARYDKNVKELLADIQVLSTDCEAYGNRGGEFKHTGDNGMH